MNIPEQPTASDTPAPTPPSETARPEGAPDTAIQEKAPAPSPSGATGITAAPTPPAPAAAPKPPPPPPSPEQRARRLRLLDGVLVGLVLVFAFLLGCYAIHNTDFWLHLATGRLLSEGVYFFGADPFSYTTAGTWINHAWLFDWLLYHLYQLTGGVGVVAVRGLVAVALALIMLRCRPAGQRLALPAVCAALALLALSPRLVVQPVLLSFLLLALTFYLLYRGVDQGATFSWRRSARPVSVLWLLPPLFALWVNLDAWFLLGPLTVALYLIGTAFQRREGVSAGRLGTLAQVLGVGLAACLLNPYLYRAFVLPPELAYLFADILPEGLVRTGLSARRAAGELPQLYADISPLSSVFWTSTYLGRNAAGLAYVPLLGLGAASFALLPFQRPGTPRRFPLARFLVWLAFAVLSLVHVRLIAFFAVVAGPITALNLLELLTSPQGERVPSRRDVDWALLGRFAAILGCVLLLALDWPGWLHGGPDDPRRSHRVRWEVSPDPSVERMAGRLNELLASGKLARGFNLRPEATNYLAWFAPSAPMFFDYRYTLPPQAAEDYARACKAFREEAQVTSGRRKRTRNDPGLREVHRLFRSYGINYVVLTGLQGDPQAIEVANRLTFEPRQWVPLYGDGNTAVFGWRDPKRPDNPFAGLQVRRGRQAFGEVPPGLRAPAKAPEPPEGPLSGWEVYAFGKPTSAPEVIEAASYLVDYQLHATRSTRWQFPLVMAEQVTACLTPPAAAPSLAPVFPRGASLWLQNNRPAQQGLAQAIMANDPGPPGLPVLAVRTARRAAAEVPADANAYSVLAEAYLKLGRTQEQHWSTDLDPRGLHWDVMSRTALRHIQHITALKLALRLEPKNAALHERLADIFLQLHYFDLALEHAELSHEYLADGPARGRDPKEHERQAVLIEQLRKEVARRRDEYRLQTVGQRSGLEKFKAAFLLPTRLPGKQDPRRPPPERGLAALALQVLGETDPSKLPAREQEVLADWQIRLMLVTGMVKELNDTFSDPDVRERLRGLLRHRYDGYEALFAAAMGRYADADRFFSGWEKNLPVDALVKQMRKLEKHMGEHYNMQILAVLPSVPLVPMLDPKPGPQLPIAFDTHLKLEKLHQETARQLIQVAELRALAGMLALEQGDTARALERFEGSVSLTGDTVNFPSRFVALRYRALLKSYK